MSYGASAKAVGMGWAEPLPGAAQSAMAALRVVGGDPASTDALSSGKTWPGAALAGVGTQAPVQLAQAGTAALGGFGQGAGRISSDAAPALERAPAGALRVGGAMVTASMLLQALQKLAERRQVEAAMARFQLSNRSVADLLAARAYVWGRNRAPMLFWKVPYSGPENERVAEGLMRFEQAQPGTLGRATSGDAGARTAIQGVVEQALRATAAAPDTYHRTSTVDPALSADSTVARRLLKTELSPSWQAHHLIPFAAMAGLSAGFQRAVVAAGWKMDSAENLIALPANFPTYVGPVNATVLPIHMGPHPIYQMRLQGLLISLAARAPPLSGETLRSALASVEAAMRDYLLLRIGPVHPVLR